MKINRRTCDDLIALATVRPGFAAARAKTMGLVPNDLPTDCLVTALETRRNAFPEQTASLRNPGFVDDDDRITVSLDLVYREYGTCRYNCRIEEQVEVMVDIGEFVIDGELDRDRLRDFLEDEAWDVRGDFGEERLDYDYDDHDPSETDYEEVEGTNGAISLLERAAREAGLITEGDESDED